MNWVAPMNRPTHFINNAHRCKLRKPLDAYAPDPAPLALPSASASGLQLSAVASTGTPTRASDMRARPMLASCRRSSTGSRAGAACMQHTGYWLSSLTCNHMSVSSTTHSTVLVPCVAYNHHDPQCHEDLMIDQAYGTLRLALTAHPAASCRTPSPRTSIQQLWLQVDPPCPAICLAIVEEKHVQLWGGNLWGRWQRHCH
jgi:hypothetical protein